MYRLPRGSPMPVRSRPDCSRRLHNVPVVVRADGAAAARGRAQFLVSSFSGTMIPECRTAQFFSFVFLFRVIVFKFSL